MEKRKDSENAHRDATSVLASAIERFLLWPLKPDVALNAATPPKKKTGRKKRGATQETKRAKGK